mgnify:CR=1 FL=1
MWCMRRIFPDQVHLIQVQLVPGLKVTSSCRPLQSCLHLLLPTLLKSKNLSSMSLRLTLPPFQCFLSYSNWSAIKKYSLVFGWLIMRASYYKTTPGWVYSRLPWLLSYIISCLWIALSFKTLFIKSNYCESWSLLHLSIFFSLPPVELWSWIWSHHPKWEPDTKFGAGSLIILICSCQQCMMEPSPSF